MRLVLVTVKGYRMIPRYGFPWWGRIVITDRNLVIIDQSAFFLCSASIENAVVLCDTEFLSYLWKEKNVWNCIICPPPHTQIVFCEGFSIPKIKYAFKWIFSRNNKHFFFGVSRTRVYACIHHAQVYPNDDGLVYVPVEITGDSPHGHKNSTKSETKKKKMVTALIFSSCISYPY